VKIRENAKKSPGWTAVCELQAVESQGIRIKMGGRGKRCKKLKKNLYICGENCNDGYRCSPEAQQKKR
jgi:hypothetical protein